MAAQPKTRTLHVKTTNGDAYAAKGQAQRFEEFRITIPATCKVTYSQLNPQQGRDFNGHAVLRIYEGTKQTAMFRNVVEFRDVAYDIERKVIRTDSKSEERVDENGTAGSHEVLVEEDWVTV